MATIVMPPFPPMVATALAYVSRSAARNGVFCSIETARGRQNRVTIPEFDGDGLSEVIDGFMVVRLADGFRALDTWQGCGGRPRSQGAQSAERNDMATLLPDPGTRNSLTFDHAPEI